jgi:putative flippase GtrA
MMYAVIAAASAATYFLLYNALRTHLRPLVANALAAACCVCLAFWANRRLAFHHDVPGRLKREFIEFTLLAASTIGASSLALSVVLASLPASRLVENLTVAASSVILTVLRFWILRSWVFNPQRSLRKKY